jgi:bifunctional DNA-binding transcriptional regulator/antitoxin component of YhaV-PrlF toxin-antitoxin module
VKIGTSRQVIIPKRVFEELRLVVGDYLEVAVEGAGLRMTPKTLVDKHRGAIATTGGDGRLDAIDRTGVEPTSFIQPAKDELRRKANP